MIRPGSSFPTLAQWCSTVEVNRRPAGSTRE
jgi:hypothetical protein